MGCTPTRRTGESLRVGDHCVPVGCSFPVMTVTRRYQSEQGTELAELIVPNPGAPFAPSRILVMVDQLEPVPDEPTPPTTTGTA